MSRRKGRAPTARPWQPLQRASAVEMTPEQENALRKLCHDNGVSEADTEALIAERATVEIWMNHKYVVTVERRETGDVAELSIRRQDRKAAHDWRDFQRIKTEVAGADVEAFEMYPAEDRLMDTANQYYLYCLPPGQQIPAGHTGTRNVRDADEAVGGSQQRPLPEDWKDRA